MKEDMHARHGNKTHEIDMGNRGVTRMMHEHDGQINKEERMQMMRTHHAQTLWIYWMLIVLGIWLILSPLTFSYAKETVQPSGGREVWLSLQNRIAAMKWSDIRSPLPLCYR